MMKTCLYPFYEYIMEEWIRQGNKLPKYTDTIMVPEVYPEGKNIELEKRKNKYGKIQKRF